MTLRRTIAISVVSSVISALVTLSVVGWFMRPRADAATGALTGTSLELKDSSGNVRVRMAEGLNGNYSVQLLDPSGRTRTITYAEDGTAGFAVEDAQSVVRSAILINANNSNALYFYGPSNGTVARELLGTNADGSPVFQMLDANGATTATLP